MESLAVLGLVGNILQFLDFGSELVSGTRNLYQSVDGGTSSNRVLEKTSRDLVQLCSAMIPDETCSNALQSNSPEAALIPLSVACRDLGNQFLCVLDDLKVKSRQRRWQSIRQALRSTWKATDIQRYESQLESFRSQIAARLLAILM